MKVRDLILKLRTLDQDALVILSSDSEGNNYSPLPIDGFEEGYYDPRNSWCGDFYSKIDFEEDDVEIDNCVPCVAIFPTN